MAIAQAKPKKTLMGGGFDATPDGRKARSSGKLAVTVFQAAVGQDKKLVGVAQQMSKGEKVDSHQWIPFERVTQQNMQQSSTKNP